LGELPARLCAVCGAPFVVTGTSSQPKRYCSPKCRDTATKQRRLAEAPAPTDPPAAVAAKMAISPTTRPEPAAEVASEIGNIADLRAVGAPAERPFLTPTYAPESPENGRC
jgi:hypothetical protein